MFNLHLKFQYPRIVYTLQWWIIKATNHLILIYPYQASVKSKKYSFFLDTEIKTRRPNYEFCVNVNAYPHISLKSFSSDVKRIRMCSIIANNAPWENSFEIVCLLKKSIFLMARKRATTKIFYLRNLTRSVGLKSFVSFIGTISNNQENKSSTC